MTIEIKMPAFRGDEKSILCAWSVDEGDTVDVGDTLFEAECDKVTSPCLADVKMKITSILADEGDEIAPGTTVALAEAVN